MGEYEQLMLDKSVVLIGTGQWDHFGDLREFRTRVELEAECSRLFPNENAHVRGSYVGQLWAYSHEMKDGDLVVVRMKTRGAIAVGQVNGPYEYRTELPFRHAHAGTWMQTDLPPDRFGQDLLFSFGVRKTVSRPQASDAETRVRAIANGQSDPGLAVPGPLQPPRPATREAAAIDNDESGALELRDLAELARDNIRSYLSRRFTGHELARLVDAVLKAQGYATLRSLPGPDGGVDILAGAGPMGFGAPRLIVQVKSGNTPVDSGVLRELQGTMQTHNAQQGLLVSWAGFKSTVPQEARRSFFSVRLWDQDALITALLDQYERLDEGIRAALPLKQVWVLAASQSDGGE